VRVERRLSVAIMAYKWSESGRETIVRGRWNLFRFHRKSH